MERYTKKCVICDGTGELTFEEANEDIMNDLEFYLSQPLSRPEFVEVVEDEYKNMLKIVQVLADKNDDSKELIESQMYLKELGFILDVLKNETLRMGIPTNKGD